MVYRSKKAKKIYREKIFKKIFWKFFLPTFLLFLGSIFLFNSNFFKIKEVKVVGNEMISDGEIKKIINEELNNKYWNIYSKNNFIFYPESELEKKLKEKENNILNVDISYQNFFSNSLTIKIEEKIPAYLFCNQEKEDECYYLSQIGNVFDIKNKNEVKERFLKFTKKFKKKPKTILMEKEFSKIKGLIFDLEKLNLKIKEVSFLDEKNLFLKTEMGTKLIFNLDQDLVRTQINLKKIFSKRDLKIDISKKDFVEKVRYINLSFGENIYYCMSGDQCQENY